MVHDRWDEVSRISAAALELAPEERAAFVARECADDEEMRAEVTSLLAQAEHTSGPLDEPVGALGDLFPAPEGALGAGDVVGSYRILEEIGGGGMGRIFLAVRDDQEFRREVALKVIRRGMDTDDFLRRFRAERRILAQLDHPNIARLLDGGATEDGRPYFVMEHIQGLPITEFCWRNSLSLEKRLRLFCQVCAAGHYAHQNLIVHRDLKPENILVTPEGVPKLLDFGIAKVLSDDPAEDTVVHTRTDQRVMTPEYASPEQVRGEAITTASDVYSLGVLLYELLSGERPYEGERTVIERAICEVEPRRPSTIKGGGRRLRGDLDNIVLMALRKEPERRYSSLQQLADDIDRHLTGLPVIARKETVFYAARKFVRRNPVTVFSSTVAAAALLSFALVTASQSKKIGAQAEAVAAERDTAEFVTGFMEDLFTKADPRAVQGAEVTARALLERGYARLGRLAGEPEVQVRLMLSMGRAFNGMDLVEEAETVLREAVDVARDLPDQQTFATAQRELAIIVTRIGRLDEAQDLHHAALELWQAEGAEDDVFVAGQLQRLGWIEEYKGNPDEAEMLYLDAAARLEVMPGETVAYAETLVHLGHLLLNRNGPDAAEATMRKAHAILLRDAPEDDPNVGLSYQNLGKLEIARQDYDAAEVLLQEALALRIRVYGPGSVSEAMSRNELAVLQRRRGDHDAAEKNYRAALETLESVLGPKQYWVVQARHNLGSVQRYRGEFEDAEALLWEAVLVGRELRPPDHPDLAHLSRTLVQLLLEVDKHADALPVAREAWRICELALEPSIPLRVEVLCLLAEALAGTGETLEARALLAAQLELLEAAIGEDDARTVQVRDALAAL